MPRYYYAIRHFVLFAFTISLLTQCAYKQDGNHEHNVPDSLAVMERDFSKYVSDHNTREAFLHFLSDTSILFKPDAVNGKKFWQELEDQGELLYWQPAYVGVAAHGNLGFTSGPYFYQPSKAADSVRYYGHYMSVWKKEGEKWRVLIDMGVAHDSTNMSPTPVLTVYESTGGTYNDLIQQENQYLTTYAEQMSYKEFFSKDCLVLRPGKFPVRSVDHNESIVEDDGVSVAYGNPTGFISDSGEVGVTYGDVEITVRDSSKVKSHFVRIWSFDKTEGWKIVLDIIGS